MTPPVPSYPAPTPLPIPHRDPVRFEFTYPLQNSFGTVSLASDTAPTASSQKFLNSGAIYTALTGKISNPSTEGTAGQLLATDGAGGRYWTTATASSVAWGSITGALANQTDLGAALAAKASKPSTGSLAADSNLNDVISKINTLIAELKI